MKAPKVSAMTQAVLDARRAYPDLLDAVKAKLNDPAPYMQRKLDYRARDKMLLGMTPEDLANLARTDPATAEAAAKRIFDLEQKAPPLPPGMGEFEGEA